MSSSATADLLIEIGTEELPPAALARLSVAFRDALVRHIGEARLTHGDAEGFATPRRLAVRVASVLETQPDETLVRKGPAVQAAFDAEGRPTKAAQGFARSCGVDVDALEREENEQGAWLCFRRQVTGNSTRTLLPGLVEKALADLPMPKRMRWGAGEVEFVRPIHWVCGFLGSEMIPGQVLGVEIGSRTRGHRFMSSETQSLSGPADYLPTLRRCYIEPDLNRRRQVILDQIKLLEGEVGGKVLVDEDVLAEVVALCEWPQAFVGGFDASFLEVPPEVLIETMQANQKYFPVVDEKGGLRPFFIGVSNIVSRDPAQVRAGNERVIRPRFADAQFFWEQDKKTPLAERRPALSEIVFQHQLGSLEAKTARVARLSGWVADQIGAESTLAERAAGLAKCDLVSLMVGEFGSLQGLMGRYYALASGEPAVVAEAIEQHYWPRHAGDKLPESPIAQAVAVADRIDTLVGIFAIGQKPTGVKDPYGLRRAAIAVLRILIETPLELDLKVLLQEAAQGYLGVVDAQAHVDEVFAYCIERMKGYYSETGATRQAGADVLAAVLALGGTVPCDLDRRILALQVFRSRKEATSLAAANKRTRNILRRSTEARIGLAIERALLTEPAEQRLVAELEAKHEEIKPLLKAGDYEAVLTALATLSGALDAFFDEVMVMAEDDSVRANRLAILKHIESLFLDVADLSLLQS